MAYNIEQQTVNGSPIIRWEVWFTVPFNGTFKDHTEACAAARHCDFEPQLMVIPTPVAITKDSYEVIYK